MRIYISADIEGVAGVASFDHLMPDRFEYERAREWMTDEVVVVCKECLALGVDEIVVSDSHGNGENLLIERFPDEVKIVRSWPRPLGMAQGIELGKYKGAIFLGYHTGGTSPNGLLAHTLSGGLFSEIRLNGVVVNETGIHAAIAGHFDVPVIMASGDNYYADEARGLLGDIEIAVTKSSCSFASTMTDVPAVAQRTLKEATQRALSRIKEFKPFAIKGPVQVEISYKHRFHAEVMSYMPGVELISSNDVQITVPDMIEASRFLNFSFSYDLNRRG